MFAKSRYWLIIDEVNTAGENQEMQFNFHTPCSMKEIEDGFVSMEKPGFLIKQDRRGAPDVQISKSKGYASLGGLPNEPTHREIDWLVFSKALKGIRQSDRMATLIYPFDSIETVVPSEVSVEQLDLKDDAAVGYLVSAKGRQDFVIVSDGKFRRFTDNIAGDFTCARISLTDRGIDYAGFTQVSKFSITGMKVHSFPAKRDFEYLK